MATTTLDTPVKFDVPTSLDTLLSRDSPDLPESCDSPDSLESSDLASVKPLSQTNTYEAAIRRVCHPEPLISTTLTTGSDSQIFELTVQVHQATYGKFLYYSIKCNVA